MRNMKSNVPHDDYQLWVRYLDAVVRFRLFGHINPDSDLDSLKIDTFSKLFHRIAEVDTWKQIVEQTVLLNEESVAQKVCKVVKSWGKDTVGRYTENHVFTVYALFIDAACKCIEKGEDVNISEEMQKLQQVLDSNLMSEYVDKALEMLISICNM